MIKTKTKTDINNKKTKKRRKEVAEEQNLNDNDRGLPETVLNMENENKRPLYTGRWVSILVLNWFSMLKK